MPARPESRPTIIQAAEERGVNAVAGAISWLRHLATLEPDMRTRVLASLLCTAPGHPDLAKFADQLRKLIATSLFVTFNDYAAAEQLIYSVGKETCPDLDEQIERSLAMVEQAAYVHAGRKPS